MPSTDLISDGFTIIRNAIMAKRENADIPSSNTIKSILDILKNENYIDNYKPIEYKQQGKLRIYLKYTAGRPAIRNIVRISKPGLRKYVKSDKVPSVLKGRGLCIVSTSKGIITGKQARELKLGGEIIGYIW